MRLFRVWMLVAASWAANVSAQTMRLVPSQLPTIKSAIIASIAGDSVVVAPGTYMENINFLGKAITVRSSAGPATTVLFGNAVQATVTFSTSEGPSSTLRGFTVRNGRPAILCQATSPTIDDCTVTANNTVGLGGAGLRCTALTAGQVSSPTVTNSRFSGNNVTLERGGAIFVLVGLGIAMPSFTDCSITGNTAFSGSAGFFPSAGGAMFERQDSQGSLFVTMTRCLVRSNAASGQVGGLYLSNPNLATLQSCTIVYNTIAPVDNSQLGVGGGIYCNGGPLVLSNCLIAGNSATLYGGGVVFGGPTATISGCTIAGNTAAGTGGLWIISGVITCGNSIIHGNSAPDFSIGVTGGTASATFSNSVLGVGPFPSSPTNLATDPLFVDAANGDYHLSPGSPCIDAGGFSPVAMPSMDLDGTPRSVGAAVDIGADELPVQPLPGTGDDLDIVAYVDGSGDPQSSQVVAPPLSQLQLLFQSPAGTFDGAQVFIAGQLFAVGMPPLGLVAIPAIHLDAASAFVVFGNPASGVILAPGLDPAGIRSTILVPPGLGGAAFRVQGFALAPIASNGLFAVTNARDIVF